LLAQQWRGQPLVNDALRGMGVVAAGLVLSTAIRLVGGLRRNAMGRVACAAFLAATVLTVGVLRWPLVGVIAALGGAALALAVWRLKP
jgi:chromate transporter